VAIINTGLLTKGLRSEFFRQFDGATTYFQDLATRIQSNSDSETYKWLGSVPPLEVDRDEIADDKTGQIRIRIGELAERAATHKDYLVAQLILNGETSGFNSYDGVTFFSNNHVSGSSGLQSNELESDAVDPNNASTEEFRDGLKAAIGAMLDYKDDQGDPMAISGTGLSCIVPTTMYLTALEAVSATVVSSTSNVLSGVARVIAFPWLSDQSKWYLLKTDGVVRPFIFQDREAAEFTALTEDSDEGFRREKFLYGVRARYRMAYGYWQFAVRMNFTAPT